VIFDEVGLGFNNHVGLFSHINKYNKKNQRDSQIACVSIDYTSK